MGSSLSYGVLSASCRSSVWDESDKMLFVAEHSRSLLPPVPPERRRVGSAFFAAGRAVQSHRRFI
jgi:hypothetical protein